MNLLEESEMSDIKEILSLRPETLAEKQHAAFKKYVTDKIKTFNQLINDEKYQAAVGLLADSPSGDGYGSDNEYLDFSETGHEDIGAVLRRLESLKTQSKKK